MNGEPLGAGTGSQSPDTVCVPISWQVPCIQWMCHQGQMNGGQKKRKDGGEEGGTKVLSQLSHSFLLLILCLTVNCLIPDNQQNIHI